MPKPLISVVTPTFNRAYILPKAIGSVLNQTYDNWELIIIDDGSTDDTKDVVTRFADERIKYHYQENTGQIVARNNALEFAKGEWIVYLDSDNTLFPEYMSVMLEEIGKRPNTLWTFPKGHRFLELWLEGNPVRRTDETSEFGDSITPKDIVHRNLHTDMNGFMQSRKIIRDGIRFDPKTKFEDWELFLQLCEKYPDNFLYVNKLLYTYTQRFGGDGVVSNSSYQEWADAFEYVYQKHKDDKLMKGQSWYPGRVKKWSKLAKKYKAGLIPPYYLYFFPEHWPEKYSIENR